MKNLLLLSGLLSISFLCASQEGKKESALEIKSRFSTTKANPLIILDGKDLKDSTALASIAPNDIESIELLNETQGLNLYGRKGIKGVLLITTKGNMNINQPTELVDPLYILDDVEIKISKLADVNTSEIEKVEVFKGKQAEPYGEKGKNVEIIITTKNHLIK